MKIGAIGIRTKIIVGDAATWYLVKKYIDGKLVGWIDDVPEELKKYVRVLGSWVDVTEDLASIENKVDKVEGSSLVPNLEIEKLAEYPEFEDLEFSHESLTDKNSEAALQHVDTTTVKATLAVADKVALYDSATGKVVLTHKSNLQTDLTTVNQSITNLQNEKQNTLVSGQNIKTINGNDITGAGNIEIPTGDFESGEILKYTDIWGYNLSHLNGITSILNANEIVSVVIIGDSITEGQVSTTPFRTYGYAGRLEAMLKNKYGNGGNGLIPFWRYKNATTKEIQISGINTGSAELYTNLAAGSSFEFIDDGTSNAAKLIYKKYSGGGKIQFGRGSAYVNVQTNNATDLLSVLQLSGVTPSVGIFIGWTENAPCRLIGIIPELSTLTKGVKCHNLGWTAKTGAQFLNPNPADGIGTAVEELTAYLNPKLEIIAFGANDYNTQVSVATFKSSVKDAVNKAIARGSKVLLVNTGVWCYEIPTDPKAIKHLTYEKAMYEVATECNIALCDVNAKWRAMGANRYLSFLQNATVHPNDLGHLDIANTIMSCIYNR